MSVWHVAEERIEERVTQCGRWMLAYDYRRVGVLQSLKCGAGRRDCLTELLVEFSCPFRAGRVTELVRFRNFVIVYDRSRPAWPTSPTKMPSVKRTQKARSLLQRCPVYVIIELLPVFSSISCHRDVTSNSISWPS